MKNRRRRRWGSLQRPLRFLATSLTNLGHRPVSRCLLALPCRHLSIPEQQTVRPPSTPPLTLSPARAADRCQRQRFYASRAHALPIYVAESARKVCKCNQNRRKVGDRACARADDRPDWMSSARDRQWAQSERDLPSVSSSRTVLSSSPAISAEELDSAVAMERFHNLVSLFFLFFFFRLF